MAASEWTSGLIMVAVDVVFAVMNTLIKEATERGLDRAVLITLRQLVAALFMAPVAFFHDRKTRPKLTLEICVYLFFSALLGASLTQYLFYLGMEYTSAAFACAFLNLTPAFTFLISLPLRLESLDWKTKPGLAKALGVVLCFLGVTVLTFYQGPVLQLSHALLRTCWKNLNGNMTCGFGKHASHNVACSLGLLVASREETENTQRETRKGELLAVREMAEGIGGAARRQLLLVVVVPAAGQSGEEVPGDLHLHRSHILPRVSSGGDRELGHQQREDLRVASRG
ncbi:hypothetical protein ZIOFF_012010 [Zingiber officinale]|uniref:WAT1-related protein n=1 Tax=Zingiber officinale TaxID=94328 RepID=A0A8J5HNV2_ZINOF|nr:hypothetical protein ZIOFF_012010 [Zingiber officinale]